MTVRENELLHFLVTFKIEHGYAPTIQEIKKGINTKSTHHVVTMLEDLQDKGFITFEQNKPRTIVIRKF